MTLPRWSSPVALETVTPAADTALSVADVKAHINLDLAEDDDLITGMIAAATGRVESILNQTLIDTGYRQTADCFPRGAQAIRLATGPLQSITSIKYLADDGAATQLTLAASVYRDLTGQPARIGLALDQQWPAIAALEQAVEVEFTAGYGADATAVPAAVKQAMKLIIGGWYEYREEIIVGTIVASLPISLAARGLLWPLRTLPV